MGDPASGPTPPAETRRFPFAPEAFSRQVGGSLGKRLPGRGFRGLGSKRTKSRHKALIAVS